jgi:hypothetical protein
MIATCCSRGQNAACLCGMPATAGVQLWTGEHVDVAYQVFKCQTSFNALCSGWYLFGHLGIGQGSPF